MKNIENIKKYFSKITDDGNAGVVVILFLYSALVLLGQIYDIHLNRLNNQPKKIIKKHTEVSADTEEIFGTIIATAKEMDSKCYYRACDNNICDWYENSNKKCKDMRAGDWIAVVGNKTYTGTSLCSETAGKFAESGNPSQKQGAYCWCKSGSDWVHHLLLGGPSYCANNGCAGNCAHGVLYSPKFRSALLKAKVQNTK